MLILGIKAAWGIAKIFCAVILFPLFLFGLVCVGLFYIAVPIFVVYCFIALVGRIFEA